MKLNIGDIVEIKFTNYLFKFLLISDIDKNKYYDIYRSSKEVLFAHFLLISSSDNTIHDESDPYSWYFSFDKDAFSYYVISVNGIKLKQNQ